MARRCAACDAEGLPRESRYCLHCGAPLAASGESGRTPDVPGYTPDHLAEVLSRRSAREGERKDVTVLVADVAGSLAMAHRLDPEELHALMDGFFALALDAVHAERGTLNQFRGDGFMALFGAPVARPEHARDAVRAALAIARAAEDYTRQVQTRYGLPFVLRMGIHTGAVWVGSIGDRLRRDYTAEGPTVGLAVRLEQAAGPGEILISAETARRVRESFALRPVGPLPLRGSPEPVEAFVVAGPVAVGAGAGADAAEGVPFTGRSAELAQALAGIESVPPGAAGWVELVGESGIGKSRLARELRLRDGGIWLQALCRESSESRAYDVWLELLRGGGDDERVRRAVRVLEGSEGAAEPGECEAAVRNALEALAPAGRPLSIALEDAQWMDPCSWRLAQALVARPPPGGIRFLVTRRSDHGAFLDAPPSCVRIALAPLAPEHAEAIARAVLSGCEDPASLAALAAERGDGHPLYVLELARALAEGGEELRDAARLEASWRRARLHLPTTLRGVIAARIDALPERAKRLLEIAAVIGGPFDAAFLARVAAEEREEVEEGLAVLRERSLLVSHGATLDFGHGLHREVAYEQVLLARRCRLHRRCAALLEEAPGADSADAASEIGRHYDQAGEPRLAARALARAGEGYLGLLAAREAVSHLRRAWELVHAPLVAGADPSLRLRIGLALGRALNSLDRAGEASSVLEALEPDDLPGSDRARLAEAWIEGAWVRFSESGEVARPLALLERGLALAGEARGLEGRAHAYRIRICHLDGAVGEAAESARRVTELATAAGERFGVAFGLGNEGYVLCDAGLLDRARECCEEALALAREARHEVATALAAGWLAKVHAFRGDTGAALHAAELARELGRRTAQEGAVYNAEIWTGYVHLLQDEPKRALEVLDRLAEINARWPTTLDWMALARLEAGRLDEAAALARRCLDAEPPRLVRIRALRTLGLALGLAKHPDREAAERAMSEALGLALELGLRPHVADVQQAFAELCRRVGDERRAAYYDARAEREWEACGMRLHVERARAGRG
jgi:class 3 adenylate cyclase